MNFLTWYRSHIWEYTPGGDPKKDLDEIEKKNPEKWDELWKQYGEYMQTTYKHEIELDLIPEEWDQLKRYAEDHGLENPQELLQAFAMDLCGYRENGSDEHDLARQWLDRSCHNY